MKELRLKIVSITPVFMYGDGQEPEFRTSEIKGMMRFWWRAIRAENDIKTLRKEEAERFGGTSKGEGKSKVYVTKLTSEELKKEGYYLLPHKGIGSFKAIDVGNEVEITFKIFTHEREIESLIYLTFILGGFGRRSRRGFGSFAIVEPKIEITLEKITELLNTIKNTYRVVNNKIINISRGGEYPWIREIIIGKGERDFSQLLVRIGDASHQWRDFSLGSIRPRMASPVYVSVIKRGEDYLPIITQLNSAFPPRYNGDLSKQKEFIEAIIGEKDGV